MKIKENFEQYFDNILNSLRSMEKNSQIFTELSQISTEIAELENYVKTAFETLDQNFQNFVHQINLFSELMNFQRKVLRFKTPEQMITSVFSYLQNNMTFDNGFIYFKISVDEDNFELLSPRNEKLEFFKQFLEEANIQVLNNLVHNRDMALLLNNISEFDRSIPWFRLKANSVIIFPVRIRDQYLGFGVFTRQNEAFSITDLSFINLNVGLLSSLIFQHYYFFKLKTRLFKQFKLKKVLEEVKYAEYFEKGPLFIFTLDPRGIILHTNAAALEKIHLDEDFIIGEKFLNLLPVEHRKSFENIINQMHESDVRFYRCPLLSSNGSEFILELYISKMELQERFNLLIIFAVDATLEYFREMQKNRKEMLNEINQFSRTMNAQVNNLLTVLVPNVSLIKTQLPEDHQVQKNLKVMEKYLNQTANLVQKFMNYDLPEIEQPEEGQINKLITNILTSLKQNFPEKVELQYSLDPGIPAMPLYPLRLTKLFKILVQNSLEALGGEGFIKVTTRLVENPREGFISPHHFYLPCGNYVEIAFADNGNGIEDWILPHIFKPFFSTKIKNEGVGLGLFIAHNIIRDYNGEIFVKSKPGEGTEIFIYLPMRGEKDMREALPGMEEVLTQRPPAILVVDDEYNIRSMLKEIFEMNGYVVFSAANGQEALDIFQSHAREIQLVVLDMVMPIMDGRTAFLEMKKIKPEQKVIIVSGYAQREDLEDMLRRGALAFMRKPFQITDILSKVKEILKSK